MLTKINMKAHF